jgi:hypothetical protein
MWAQTSGVDILCTTEGYCSIPNNGYISLGSCPFIADKCHEINPLIGPQSAVLAQAGRPAVSPPLLTIISVPLGPITGYVYPLVAWEQITGRIPEGTSFPRHASHWACRQLLL